MLPLLAVAVPLFEVAFIPEFAPEEAVPVEDALEPAWSEEPGVAVVVLDAELLSEGVPVSCTSFPTRVRRLSSVPVNL